MSKKYYIVKINKQLNTVEYKRYKCIEGWSKNKDICWAFTMQGAKNIIKNLEYEYRRNIHNLEFIIEEA